MSMHWNGREKHAGRHQQRSERLDSDKMTTGGTGVHKGVVEIIVEKFGNRWNKMEKYF